MIDIIESLENSKCTFCKKDAKYIWIKHSFFGLYIKGLCEEHRLMRKHLK
jgi:hypothetical protein